MIITPKEEYEKLTNGSQKKVEVECDSCGKIYFVIYRNYYISQVKKNFSGLVYCGKCAVVSSNQSREYNPSNNYISSDGYRMVRTQKGKINNIGWKTYKKEHILIVEKNIGRNLNKSEVIHHIDNDKLNNDINNLYLCENDSEHRAIHTALEKIGFDLYKRGLLEFVNGKYVANVKLRELLEHPEEDNQQPSLSSNTFEGSETSSESILDNNSTTSAGHSAE